MPAKRKPDITNDLPNVATIVSRDVHIPAHKLLNKAIRTAIGLYAYIVEENAKHSTFHQSLETIAQGLGTTTRSITRWAKTLEAHKMLYTQNLMDDDGWQIGTRRVLFSRDEDFDSFVATNERKVKVSDSLDKNVYPVETPITGRVDKNVYQLVFNESLLRKVSAPSAADHVEATPPKRKIRPSGGNTSTGDPKPEATPEPESKPKTARKRKPRASGETPVHPDFRTLQVMLVETAFKGNQNQFGRAGVLAKWLTGVDWKGTEGVFVAPNPTVTPDELRLFLNGWNLPDFPQAVPSLDRHLTPWLTKRRANIATAKAQSERSHAEIDPAGAQLAAILGKDW